MRSFSLSLSPSLSPFLSHRGKSYFYKSTYRAPIAHRQLPSTLYTRAARRYPANAGRNRVENWVPGVASGNGRYQQLETTRRRERLETVMPAKSMADSADRFCSASAAFLPPRRRTSWWYIVLPSRFLSPLSPPTLAFILPSCLPSALFVLSRA